MKKINSIKQRLSVIEELLAHRALSQQQLRLLYGSTQRLQSNEIDAILVGDNEELRAERRCCASRANNAIDLIERVESEGNLDGKVVASLFGGISYRLNNEKELDTDTFNLVTWHAESPLIELTLEVSKSDLQTFSSKVALSGVSIEEELNRLCNATLRGYLNDGLIGVSSFKRAMVSTLDLPPSSLLFTQSPCDNRRLLFYHSHHLLCRYLSGKAHGSGENNDHEDPRLRLHLLLSYQYNQFIWVSMISQTGNGSAKVVYGARHRFKKEISESLNIAEALVACVTASSCVSDIGDLQWAKISTLRVVVELVRNAESKARESHGLRVAEKAKDLFCSKFQAEKQSVCLFREALGDSEYEAQLAAKSLATLGEDGNDVSRCTVGILTGPEASMGTMIPFITPFHPLGHAVTKVIDFRCPAEMLTGLYGRSLGLTVLVGINFNSNLGLIDVSAGDPIDALYKVIVPAPPLPPLETCDKPKEDFTCKMLVRLKYCDRRTIEFNYTFTEQGSLSESDGGSAWMEKPVVIHGGTDPLIPLTAVTNEMMLLGGEIDVEMVTISEVSKNMLARDGRDKGPSWSCAAEANTLKEHGNALLQSGKPEDFIGANHLYSLAIAHDPKNAVLWSNRSASALHVANTANESHYLHAALFDARRCVSLKPDWAKAHVREGDVHFRLGDYSLAVDCYKRALNLDPTSISTNEKLILSLERKEIQDRALKEQSTSPEHSGTEISADLKPSNCSCM